MTAVASLSAGAVSLNPSKSISQFAHTSWTAKDGIPCPVRAIAQTKDGYLWSESNSGIPNVPLLRDLFTGAKG
jgi:ligand-binding sensor domain-containing protein